MISPDQHEQEANTQAVHGNTDEALVHALLAVASAIDQASERLTCELLEHRPKR